MTQTLSLSADEVLATTRAVMPGRAEGLPAIASGASYELDPAGGVSFSD